MNAPLLLHAFTAYGIELEYMIVDSHTLSVLPVADELLRRAAGKRVSDVERGKFGWSNEMVLHLVELKNARPDSVLENLPAALHKEIQAIDQILEPMGARLMPSAMHPWMDPRAETRLWPHDNALIYQSYDRIFNCRKHGQANLQSMHLNLPFADDLEFARLHAAIRLLLPIIPAFAASSPIADGKVSGFLDYRLEAYRTALERVPSAIGQVIPDTVNSRAEYEERILAPLYKDISGLDTEGVMQHEWLNARGAIPRFDRNAIEIREIDIQECPQADLAIAAAVSAIVQALYDGKWSALATQQAIGTDELVKVLHACLRDAEQAVIDGSDYLRLLGFPERQCQAGELWRHLVETAVLNRFRHWREPLQVILQRGPLARRILRAVGPDCSRARLHEVYGKLCDCLATGQMFMD